MYTAAVVSTTASSKIDTDAYGMCRGLARQSASRIVAACTPQKATAVENLFSEGD